MSVRWADLTWKYRFRWPWAPSLLCVCVYVCAGVWADGWPAGVWRPLLWSFSPAVHWPVSGSQGEIPLWRMRRGWVILVSDKGLKRVSLKHVKNVAFLFSVAFRCTHVLCVQDVRQWGEALHHTAVWEVLPQRLYIGVLRHTAAQQRLPLPSACVSVLPHHQPSQHL